MCNIPGIDFLLFVFVFFEETKYVLSLEGLASPTSTSALPTDETPTMFEEKNQILLDASTPDDNLNQSEHRKK